MKWNYLLIGLNLFILLAHDFKQVQQEVYNIIKDRIVVGHALQHDFKMLMLDHPRKMIRDTSLYEPFRKIAKGKTPSLKRLANEELGMTIQTGRHSSVRIKIFFRKNCDIILIFLYLYRLRMHKLV